MPQLPTHAIRPAALLLCAAIGLSAPGALAGTAASPAPRPAADAVDAQPSRSTEVFGDWTVVCVAIKGAAGPGKSCEAATVIQRQDGKGALAKLAIGRSDAGFAVGALLPVNVGFPSAVELDDAGKGHKLRLDWRRCLPGACLAEAQMKASELDGWTAQRKPFDLSFVTASAQKVTLPVSPRGLAQAIAALPKPAK